MIADYSAEIKITIFQSIWNANMTNEDHRQIVGESRQKNCAFNSVNSDIIGRVHHIWTRCSTIIAIEPLESGFTISQSVVECRRKE